MSNSSRLSASSITGDIYGGITAAVVALPLALAFGVASGVGPIAGLYGAIAVGFFAAIFGGTGSQVSGPTGPMTVVMGAIVTQYADNLPTAFAIVFLGGALQIVFGLMRVGRYVSYTPYSVVSGFMSGIGVIIILIQTLPFFGLATVPGGPVAAISLWPTIASTMNTDALIIAIVSLGIMIFWPGKWSTYLPAPLAALLAGTTLATLAFPAAPIIGHVPTGFPEINLPSLALSELSNIIQPALILALLGSIDSLLTSLVADSITKTRHNSNRELIGQGIGNMAAGLIGGLPGAGATMRTVVNVRAGGRTPLSGALHSVVLLALVLGLGSLAEQIPHAVLAGILVHVGWNIIDWGYLKRIKRAPRDKVLVMVVTLLLTVFVDLITAVAVGLILASFVTARWMEAEELREVTAIALPENGAELSADEKKLLEEIQDLGGKVQIVQMRGLFSYASARQLVQHVSSLTAGDDIIILDFSEAAHVDTSGALAIEEMLETAGADARGCYVSGLTGKTETILRSLNVLDKIDADHIVPNRKDALKLATKLLA